ncbi:MAG: amidohydrolase family protein [Phycisphaerales bacterium]|nr:amidohydrolase family protein [Phycisphaerales bacterium]
MLRAMLPAALTAVICLPTIADDPAPRPNGPFQRAHRCHALTGADVIVRPGEVIEDATIVVRDGVIEAVGTDVTIPPDARLWPCDDLVVHAGFIEPARLIDVDHEAGAGTHWNGMIHPQTDLATAHGGSLGESDIKALREAGWCVVAVHPGNGILRGTGTITTTDEAARHRLQYEGLLPQCAGTDRGGWGGGSGPGSLMGALALMRQVLMDARWQAAAESAAQRNRLEPPARRDDLAALLSASLGEHPMLFETDDVKDAMRAGALADELGLDIWIRGNGTEYRDLDGIASLNAPVIVPVKYPDRPKLDTIDAAQRTSLRTLQAWEQAPTNLRRLRDAGIRTVVTSDGLAPDKVVGALRGAISAGLTPDQALAAVTTQPASLLGIDGRCGTIEPGKAAHLVVRSDAPFEKDAKIKSVWVGGRPTELNPDPLVSMKSQGVLHIGDHRAPAEVDTDKKSISLTLADETKVKAKAFNRTGHRISAAVDGRLLGETNWVRLAGVITDKGITGRAVRPDGTSLPMSFALTDEVESEDATPDEQPVEVAEREDADPVAGIWIGQLEIPGAEFAPPFRLELQRDGAQVTGTIDIMDSQMPVEDARWNEADGTLRISRGLPGGGEASFNATITGNAMVGTAIGPMGEAPLSASREDAPEAGDETSEDEPEADVRYAGIPEAVPFPLGARGRFSPVEPQDVRIENATLWTCGPHGLIEDGCIVVRDGLLDYVGPIHTAPKSNGERVIDAEGMHVTPGLIDCHSHTGISGGVNEFSNACTAHVGIGDVVAGDDMNWYRQLAGGLTAANQLHGSANPIGGRNSVVKLRWGRPARAFPVEGAPTGIKFALGENVKRSSGRYPDTRMGVESFIRDRFAAASHYADTWDRWNGLSEEEQLKEMPPRWDARLETLAEILAGERLIHCHSYRQDEILALLRTCEAYGVRIGTLQHILEGYKVADAIADHGAGASSFSDWWAYKVEVMDAIPHNGSIMHDVGVVVSFNSDDSELATRMNDEAAKAVRYGGVAPMEALKFVCLNPARQLGIDHLTGSLEKGKAADLAIWNHPPLSSYARCEQTWIDGAPVFTRADDEAMKQRDRAERARLVELILAQSLGKPPSPPDPGESETTTAWVNPYHQVEDHRGVCGGHAPADDQATAVHTHEEVH